MNRTRKLLLWAAATDSTFVLRERAGRQQLEGKCIHCNRRLCIDVNDPSATLATLEHILPRNHGGDDDLENLAVACRRCNSGKGHRLDHRHSSDPTFQEVLSTLRARRRERSREPLSSLSLPLLWP